MIGLKSFIACLTFSLLLVPSIFSNSFAGGSINKIEVKNCDGVMYYEKPIEQGVEFVFINNAQLIKAKLGKEATKSKLRGISEYYEPKTPIAKEAYGRVVNGVWYGGVTDQITNGLEVASSTIAKSFNSQSKASVKPGHDARWVSSEWGSTDEWVFVHREVGLLGGNKAAWDLR